jgi:hypothetical protein
MAANDVGILAWRSESEMQQPALEGKTVALLGNSQVERGFSGSQFNADFAGSGVTVIRLDAPKTYEETWYYELKRVDPEQNKYRVVVLTLPDFTVEPFVELGTIPNYSNATLLAPLLGPRDWIDVIAEYRNPGLRLRVAELAVFASHRYAFDLQDLALNWGERAKENAEKHSLGGTWRQDPPFIPGTWSDLQVKGNEVVCPSLYDHFDCLAVRDALQPLSVRDSSARTAINTAYEKKWLGKIFDLYRNSATQILIVQMPRGAGPIAHRTPIEHAPDIRTLFPPQDNVTFADPELLAPLETADLMHDHVHVSSVAVPLFTKLLGARMIEAADSSGGHVIR